MHWQEWYLKAAVLFSLLLQALLLMLATFRKRTSNSIFNFFFYGIYLLSNNVASATFSFLVGARFFAINKMPFGLWAAIMLLHMAGQERLTAYSLEENDHWRSSTIRIFWKLIVHLGLFIISQRDMPLPTRIMFFLALWRICCRAFRLRMGSQDMMIPGILPSDGQGTQQLVHVPAEEDDSQMVGNAHSLLKSSSLPLLAEIRCSAEIVDRDRQFFLRIANPSYAIRIAEIELNFIYESFHTDGTIRKHFNNNLTIVYAVLRSFESLFCAMALIFFINGSSKYLQSAHISRADYNVTNLLLWGTIAIELLSYIMTVFSDWTIAALRGNALVSERLFRFVPHRQRCWSAANYPVYNNAPVRVRFARNSFRRWSETISKFNFLRYSIQTCALGPRAIAYMRQLDELTGVRNLITSLRFVSDEWYTDHLGQFVFTQLRAKPMNIITTLRAEMWPTDDSFKTSVLVWHITTELLYNFRNPLKECPHRRYSKALSDYMAYLLFMKPHFMPKSRINPLEQSEAIRRDIQEIAGQHRTGAFEDRLRRCCKEIINQNLPQALLDDDYEMSLALAIARANELHNAYVRDTEGLWRNLSEGWVDILLYAATKYDRSEHVRGLCRGGELISIVWLLAFHLGFLHREANI